MNGEVRGKIRYLYPTDITTIILCIFFSICSFCNTGKMTATLFGMQVDRELLQGFAFIVYALLVVFLIRFTNGINNKIVQFVRLFYVQVFYITFFTECIYLSQLFYGNHSLDRFFADLDFLMFHYQPAIEFYKSFEHNPYINELFFFSYFIYYFLITSGWWFLYFRKKYEAAAYCLFVTSVAFGLLYIWYVFFPVKGPKFFFESLNRIWYDHFSGFYFTNAMKKVFAVTNLGGAAFPSSHVAISLVALLLNRTHNKYALPFFFPFTVSLIISTIYLYAHYFVDIIGGVFAAILLYTYVPLLYPIMKKWAGNIGGKLYDSVKLPAIALFDER